MARLSRKNQLIFAGDATNSGQFGSAQLGTKLLSNDLDVLQQLPAYVAGWDLATITSKRFPPQEEFQALDYIETYQLAYIFQEGIPEYLAAAVYYQNSIVKKPGTYQLYGSIGDGNTGHALPAGVSDANWQFLVDLSVSGKVPYGVCTGLVNNYLVTTSPVFSAYADGQLFIAQINITNTGAVQINANSIGAVAVTLNGLALVGGELKGGRDHLFIYDSVAGKMQLANPNYGTAASFNTGVAGHTIPFLDGINTISAQWTFSVSPLVPTPTAGDNSSKAVNSAFVVAGFAPITSPAFLGTPTAPTPGGILNTTRIPTTAYIFANYAPINSPTFTGTPIGVTPATGDRSTKIPTTEWVGFNLPQKFESVEVAIPAAQTAASVAHGLGSVPDMYAVAIRCKIADSGYAVGDEVFIPTHTYTGGAGGQVYELTIGCNATNIFFNRTIAQITVANKTTGAFGAINTANWKLIFRAVAFA